MNDPNDEWLLDALDATDGFRAYINGREGLSSFMRDVSQAVKGAHEIDARYSEGLLYGFSAVNLDTHGVNLDFLRVQRGFARQDVKTLVTSLQELQDDLRRLQAHAAELAEAAATSVKHLSQDFGLQPVYGAGMWWAHPDDVVDPDDLRDPDDVVDRDDME